MRADDEAVRAELGRIIRGARGSRSQQWLAEQVGAHQTTVSDWERGRTAPAISRLPEIERVLGLPDGALRAVLLGRAEPPPQDDTDFLARLEVLERAVADLIAAYKRGRGRT